MSAIKQRQINERFARLEERVFRIELRLGPDVAPAAVAAANEHAEVDTIAPTLEQAATEATPQSSAQAVTANLLEKKRAHAVPPPLPAILPPPTGAPGSVTPINQPVDSPLILQSIPYASSTRSLPAAQGALERTIGLKWAGWAGALILVIGAALGVKFIYDQHWFAQVPPAIWLSGIFLGGLALIGVGEVIYTRVHIIPAASVFGAGVATLFLAGYVGHAYYNLYSPGAALFLMAAAALVGALVAMRGNLVSIAVLSHIGANLAPLLVGSRSAPLESFLVYLLALQMVALSLASWGKGQKWWTLRGLSLATTALWIVGTGLRPEHEPLVLGFSLVYAIFYHGELIHSAMRKRDGSSPTIIGPDGITFSLLVTASLTLVVLWWSRSMPHGERGAIVLAMAGISAALGWILARGIKEAPDAIRKIAVAHRIAAAALVALAIPVSFTGLHADFAWVVLAVAFAVEGAKTRSPIARTAAIVTWFIAVFHLAISTCLPADIGGHATHTWFDLFGTAITREAGLAFALSLIGQIIAALTLHNAPQADRAGKSLSVVASALWVVASVHALPALAATAWIVEYAWLLVAAETLVPQLRFSLQSAGLILLATAKWLVVDTLADRLAPGWSADLYRPVFNPMLGIDLLLCASIITLYGIRRKALWRSLREQDDPRRGWNAVTVIVALLITYGLSFEIDRVVEQMSVAGTLLWPLWQAKQLAWTIAFTLASAGAFAILRYRDPNPPAEAKWPRVLPAVLGLLALKYLTMDTTLWRLLDAPANVPVLTNLEAAAGAVVFAAMVMLVTLGLPQSMPVASRKIRRLGILAAALVLLWNDTIEIDRHFAAVAVFNGAVRPEQVALSIFWSIFAVASVLLGFRIRSVQLRYFGLVLFAITLLKVVLIDLSQVQAGYRILSFIGLGALLLGTSVLYGKFSPRLLRQEAEVESHVTVGG